MPSKLVFGHSVSWTWIVQLQPFGAQSLLAPDFPSVEGEVIGPFGEVHTASPVKRIPTAESRQFADEPHNGESIGVTVTRRTPI